MKDGKQGGGPAQVPVTSEGPDSFGSTTYMHPSYGSISASRVSGQADLFGSGMQHQHFVVVRVGAGVRIVEEHGNERYRSRDMGGGYIEFAMSETQWGQFLSSMNMGSGVPCTLLRVGGERRPPCPPSEKKANFHRAIETGTADAAKALADLREKLAVRFGDPKPIGKAERKDILGEISTVVRTISDHLPFIQRMLDEATEQQVAEAKAEIEGFLQFKAQALGLQNMVQGLSLGSGQDLPSLPEATKREEHPPECMCNYPGPCPPAR